MGRSRHITGQTPAHGRRDRKVAARDRSGAQNARSTLHARHGVPGIGRRRPRAGRVQEGRATARRSVTSIVDARSISRMLAAWMFVGAILCAVGLARQALPPTRQVPAASPYAAANVRFADITVEAGLSGFRHVSGSAEKNYIIETTGSGVALWDYDGDGLLDIYLVNGST